MQEQIKTQIKNIELRINNALKDCKSENEITLIAVSKKKSIQHIQAAYENGIRHFGENYAQELEEKNLNFHRKVTWHFIGPIQSNKTKIIAKNANWVHSIDREKVAYKLNSECESLHKKINACIQVNISNESSKSGIEPQTLIEFADYLKSLENINLKGIMVLPSLDKDGEIQMRDSSILHQKLMQIYPDASYLSMGTTNDFESAIKFGSNMIRVGEQIFGKR